MNFDIVMQEAQKGVQEQAHWMKKALDANNIKEALKHSSKMLDNLKVNDVSPPDYYALFMQVFDELMTLEQGFRDEFQRGKKKMSDIYEVVQHAQGIIPRLYLMITTGSVVVDSGEKTADQIIKDLFYF